MNKYSSIKLFSQIFVVAILAAFTNEGVSMSLFSNTEEEVVLFSEMEGQITINGMPVQNAKIERKIKWKDDSGELDFIDTDGNGYFFLHELNAKAKLNTLSQFVVSQELIVHYKNEKYLIWTMGKLSKFKFGELGGEPINLRCDLKDEPVRVEVENGLLGTSCKWDLIKK